MKHQVHHTFVQQQFFVLLSLRFLKKFLFLGSEPRRTAVSMCVHGSVLWYIEPFTFIYFSFPRLWDEILNCELWIVRSVVIQHTMSHHVKISYPKKLSHQQSTFQSETGNLSSSFVSSTEMPKKMFLKISNSKRRAQNLLDLRLPFFSHFVWIGEQAAHRSGKEEKYWV